MKHKNVFQLMEKWAPKNLAFDWDPIGLQVGLQNDETKNILVTLDVLENVVDEAIENNVNLIISHHPLIFNPLKNIDLSSPKGKTIQKLIQHNITVYTAHTNLDVAEGGVNDLLARKLDIEVTDSLVSMQDEKLYKVAVYVPLSHIEKVREAFNKGGAGHIGNYSHCTFQTEGEGTFKPLKGSDPYSGKIGEIKFADEKKIESIVPEQKLASVIHEIKKAHPYEEVAYDVYKLHNKGKEYGLGRVGKLKEPMTVKQLAEKVKERYELEGLKITGSLEKKVQKVAILGGSGEKYIFAAKNKGAEVFITGDMTFHLAQEAMEMGLVVIDAGHYIEEIMIEATRDYIVEQLKDSNINVITSTVCTNPFTFL